MMQFLDNLKLILNANMPHDFIGGMAYVLEKYGNLFLKGFFTTLLLALFGTVFGLIIGMVISLMRQTKITIHDSFIIKLSKKIGHVFSTIYVQYLRGTPMLVQGMIVHLGLSRAGFKVNPLLLGIVVISINTSAYMAEILRSSIGAINKGQLEAARALGMTEVQGMRYFVLPQAFKNALPAIGNEFVVNAKDSSVLNVIMVAELFYQAKIIGQITYRPLEPLILISLIYLTITILSTYLLNKLEQKMDKPKGTYPTSMTHQIYHFKGEEI